jgi:hypothetical protein
MRMFLKRSRSFGLKRFKGAENALKRRVFAK